MKVLIPLPSKDFDPSEAAISWSALDEKKIPVIFSTPKGYPASGDVRMVKGTGLGIWKKVLQANARGVECYRRMVASPAFKNPIPYSDIREKNFSAILLPGGHAKGMIEYLESKILQNTIVDFFRANKPVGAICHGTLLAARSVDPETKRSVLFGRKTTSLLKTQELLAWSMTCLWLKDYYRTYSVTTEDEVRSHLENSQTDFFSGPMPLKRDTPRDLRSGFTVIDKNYISARWPGDAHKFANDFIELVKANHASA